jgi:hypothetical protein
LRALPIYQSVCRSEIPYMSIVHAVLLEGVAIGVTRVYNNVIQLIFPMCILP